MWSQRVDGIVLLVLTTIFSARLYCCAPWYLSTDDFLLEPLRIFALPLLVSGLILTWKPCPRPPFYAVGCLIGMAVIGVLMSFGSWPPPNTPYTWEDSYQELAVFVIVLEGAFRFPLWLCCGVVILYRIWPHWALWKRFR